MTRYEEIRRLVEDGWKRRRHKDAACDALFRHFASGLVESFGWPENLAHFVALPQNEAYQHLKDSQLAVREGPQDLVHVEGGFWHVGLELHTVNGQWFRFRMQARPEGDAFRLRVGTGEEFTVQPETSGALEEAYSAVFKELTRLARTPDERPEKEFGFRTGTLQ